jgi:hypothetical protein
VRARADAGFSGGQVPVMVLNVVVLWQCSAWTQGIYT